MSTEYETVFRDLMQDLSKETQVKHYDPKFYNDDLHKSELERIKLRTAQSYLDSIEDDRKARKIYTPLTFGFVGIYLIVAIIIFCRYQFYLIPNSSKYISASPIIALLTSTV